MNEAPLCSWPYQPIGALATQNQETTMFTTVKTLALTLGLTILAAAPAMAALSGNGLWTNGYTQNGWGNGLWANGYTQNGWSANGWTANGRLDDAHAVRVIGIELPSDAVVR